MIYQLYMKIVIIMPAYNEAENIGSMIEELFNKELPQIKKRTCTY